MKACRCGCLCHSVCKDISSFLLRGGRCAFGGVAGLSRGRDVGVLARSALQAYSAVFLDGDEVSADFG